MQGSVGGLCSHVPQVFGDGDGDLVEGGSGGGAVGVERPDALRCDDLVVGGVARGVLDHVELRTTNTQVRRGGALWRTDRFASSLIGVRLLIPSLSSTDFPVHAPRSGRREKNKRLVIAYIFTVFTIETQN